MAKQVNLSNKTGQKGGLFSDIDLVNVGFKLDTCFQIGS